MHHFFLYSSFVRLKFYTHHHVRSLADRARQSDRRIKREQQHKWRTAAAAVAAATTKTTTKDQKKEYISRRDREWVREWEPRCNRNISVHFLNLNFFVFNCRSARSLYTRFVNDPCTKNIAYPAVQHINNNKNNKKVVFNYSHLIK